MIYAETSNRLTYFADALAELMPRSVFIHLHRHPGDVVRSGMRRGYYVSNEWDRWRITPRPTDPFAEEWDRWDSFSRTCWYWRAVNEVALQTSAALGSQRAYDLPSSVLFQANLPELAKLFNWIGADVPADDAVQGVLSVRHNEQSSGKFPAWRDWSGVQKAELRRIAGDVAERLGYDLS